ncbi:MAG: hypothetical protein LIO86_11540, partial [Lachnospiraceae bacterium]|nr:hypothetical protein [Lachnospiraceae bacterium]
RWKRRRGTLRTCCGRLLTVMRSIYSADGSYGRAFLIAGIFGLAGLILTFAYRLITKSKKG